MKKIFILLFMTFLCNTLFADNLVLNYFKKWVDETRVEKSIGNLLFNQFTKDLSSKIDIKENNNYSKSFILFLEKFGSKNNNGLEPKVIVIESTIPDEILLPGGILLLTSGYLQFATTQEQIDFILARNAFLTIQKQPLAVIKHNGIYPKFLDYLKLKENKRSEESARDLLRSYLTVVRKMNHKKADIQGALITSTPEKTRLGAIDLLSNFSVTIWPPSPFDNVDLPSRISDLKNIKLPEQKL